MTLNSLSQSPTDPDFVQNPYPFYDKGRAAGPLFHWTDYGFACAASYDAVNTLLRDRRFGREAPPGVLPPPPGHLAPFYAVEQHSMLEREPPTHTRLRKLVLHAFTSRRISALAPEIETLSHHLIDRFEPGEIDLIPTFAERLPVIIIARLLGVPEEMADQLLRWSHDMVAMYQARRDRALEDRAVAATLAFSDYLRDLIVVRRDAPQDDLLSHLIAARDASDRLSEDEIIATAILLLNAGHEATVHTIGNGVKTLLETGTVRDLSAPGAIEEILRYDPPLHMFTRYATEPMEIFGHRFEIGDQVGLLLAAANHDPERTDDPGRFDPTRASVSHLSFGAGLHFCVGAPLARLELEIGFGTLFKRCPDLQLAASPVYANKYHFHGLESLRVTC